MGLRAQLRTWLVKDIPNPHCTKMEVSAWSGISVFYLPHRKFRGQEQSTQIVVSSFTLDAE